MRFRSLQKWKKKILYFWGEKITKRKKKLEESFEAKVLFLCKNIYNFIIFFFPKYRETA